MNNNHNIIIVSKRLGLSGQNVVFQKEPFFGLYPGEKITQIGDGRENGTIRTDKFPYPVEYVGSVLCEFMQEEKMFAFRIPDKTENDDKDIYLLYGSTGKEIFTEAVLSKKNRLTGKTTGYMRFYKPKFIRSTNVS